MQKFLKPGQPLFFEAEPSHSLFIIQRGALSIRKAKGNAFVEVGRVQSGEIIGELSFFDRLPRSATAIAIVDVEVIEITFDAMEKIYQSIPSYMRSIVACMADRLRKANETIRALEEGQLNLEGEDDNENT